MILNLLRLKDFGVFSGLHTIDLAPRVKYGKKRPIVLFGGLNGAGKTTTLTAIRLALYGRQSLGRNVSTTDYHQQLKDYIHRPNKSNLVADNSSVELEFTYGKHGTSNEYKVIRRWVLKSEKIVESLAVTQDGEDLDGLSEEQLQSFLNELIPIGVAELFFFDGEKIADLAEDTSNIALADAINRLLGIDIIERLRNDLSIYLKEHTQNKLPSDIAKELKQHEKNYQSHYRQHEHYLAENIDLHTKSVGLGAEIASTTQRINDLGGAWANSKQAEELRTEQLIKQKSDALSAVKDLFSDSIPLALANKALNKLLGQLKSEKDTKAKLVARKELNKYINELRTQLRKQIGDKSKNAIESAIGTTFSSLLENSKDSEIILDITDSDYEKLVSLITSYVPQQVAQLKNLSDEIIFLEKKLEAAAKNIARAPEQSRLEGIIGELGKLQTQKGSIEKEMEINRDNAKKELRAAMEHLRRLRDLDEKYSKSMSHSQAVELASNTRGMLLEFAEKTKARKLVILEREFVKSFSKLARKDDMNIAVSIDPQTFCVSLTNGNGKVINKKKLSAGEKQIYAIAMLEALGRTSGRNLPIIIDTPLGRLDSKHRKNLIQNYFPTASHQVLILSTDTEIDEDFYRDLSPEISHAFSVDYDSKMGCSNFNEGYFWRTN